MLETRPLGEKPRGRRADKMDASEKHYPRNQNARPRLPAEDNVLITAVEIGMANQYILDLSKNVKRGLHEKARSGVYPAHAPLGYLNDPVASKGTKTLVRDPERWDSVRKLFDLMLTGAYTPKEIWRKAHDDWRLTTKNGGLVQRSAIYKTFQNSIYYGRYEYPLGSGAWHNGIHEPMITEDEYDRIQSLSGRTGKARPQSHTFDFTGMIRCGTCGAMVTAEKKTKRQKNGNVHVYVYYHCSWRTEVPCDERSVRDTDLLATITEVTNEISLPPEFHAWAMQWLKNDLGQDIQNDAKMAAHRKKEYDDALKQKDALIKMRARGELTEEEFANQKSELNHEIARLASLAENNGSSIDAILDKADKKLIFAVTAKEKLLNGVREERREVLANLGSNLSLKAQKLRMDIEKPLLRIKDIAKEVNDIHGRFEPPGTSGNAEDVERLYASSPSLRRGRDSNPRGRLTALPR